MWQWILFYLFLFAIIIWLTTLFTPLKWFSEYKKTHLWLSLSFCLIIIILVLTHFPLFWATYLLLTFSCLNKLEKFPYLRQYPFLKSLLQNKEEFDITLDQLEKSELIYEIISANDEKEVCFFVNKDNNILIINISHTQRKTFKEIQSWLDLPEYKDIKYLVYTINKYNSPLDDKTNINVKEII